VLLKEILERKKHQKVAEQQPRKDGITIECSAGASLKLSIKKQRVRSAPKASLIENWSKHDHLHSPPDIPHPPPEIADLNLEIDTINGETNDLLEKFNKSTDEFVVTMNKKIEHFRRETIKQIEVHRALKLEQIHKQQKEIFTKTQHEQEIAILRSQIIQLGHVPMTLSSSDTKVETDTKNNV